MKKQNLLPSRIGSFSLSILLIGLCLPSLADKKSSLLWEKPVTITPVEKPRRPRDPERQKRIVRKIVNKKPVLTEKIPLLALRWSARKGGWADAPDPAKLPKPANPEDSFKVGDHLQLVVEVNQDGYLYMIQEKDLTMIFPDARINGGKNFLKKGQKITIPSNCTPDVTDKNGNCWFEVANKDDAITLIFSRDKIDNLPNSADDSGTVIVKKEVLAEVKSGSRQQFSKTNPDATTVQFTNLNKNDNEELIIETKIKHQ
jgi:hypothetical protein